MTTAERKLLFGIATAQTLIEDALEESQASELDRRIWRVLEDALLEHDRLAASATIGREAEQ